MRIGNKTRVWQPSNIYGEVKIGLGCMIGAFVEIQDLVEIGDRARIQSHSFICSGVTIGNDVFVGHGVMFINDNHPRVGQNWKIKKTVVEDGASIGSNSTILGGVVIGKGAMVGAGSVVTKDVPPGCLAYGNPARVRKGELTENPEERYI